MIRIVDEDLRQKVLAICNKLEKNGYIREVYEDTALCQIQVTCNFGIDVVELCELFKAKGFQAHCNPNARYINNIVYVSIGKSSDLTLDECFEDGDDYYGC